MTQYKPQKPTSAYSEEELLEMLRSGVVDKKLDKISSADVKEITGLTKSIIKNRFHCTVNDFILKAGLKPKNIHLATDEQIFADLKVVYDALGRRPTKEEYNEIGIFSTAITQRRFRGIFKAYEKLDDYLNQYGPEALLKISPYKLVERKYVPSKKGKKIGPIINFRQLLHAPINEQGVVFLFGLVAKDLGFTIENVQPGYPDCIAFREITKDESRKVSIEFEIKSKNFSLHKHNPDDCDLIVCWEDNWKGCSIEVIELKEEIKKLK